MIKKNIAIIGTTLILYFINQHLKSNISFSFLQWVMSCYFNDFIGGITFVAYCNIFFELHRRPTKNLILIETLLLFSGLFWEYITPIYSHDTISDPWDIVAYMCGGLIYWLLVRRNSYGAD